MKYLMMMKSMSIFSPRAVNSASLSGTSAVLGLFL